MALWFANNQRSWCKKWVEGRRSPNGSAICVVEDTVTAGGSLVKAIKHLENDGLVVKQCISVVDREEGAKEAIENAGYPFAALVPNQI